MVPKRPVDLLSVFSLVSGLLTFVAVPYIIIGPKPWIYLLALPAPLAWGLGFWGMRRTKGHPLRGGYKIAGWGFFLGLFQTVIAGFIGMGLIVFWLYNR